VHFVLPMLALLAIALDRQANDLNRSEILGFKTVGSRSLSRTLWLFKKVIKASRYKLLKVSIPGAAMKVRIKGRHMISWG
jgi:hypothetical protein